MTRCTCAHCLSYDSDDERDLKCSRGAVALLCRPQPGDEPEPDPAEQDRAADRYAEKHFNSPH